MKRFEARQAILEAAGQTLTQPELRRLRLAMAFRPIKTQAAIDTVVLNCQAAQLVTEDGEVEAAADWAAILKVIMELLPMILKLFGL
jgi:ABC-type transport system involved in Fe-S cluster assembly fused permease/ATPase subunit